MRRDRTAERILQLLEDRHEAALSAAEIGLGLGIRGKGAKKLQGVLYGLVAAGSIVRSGRGRYALGAPEDLVAGVIDVSRGGNGFVTDATSGRSVFVRQQDMGTALPGDRVVTRVVPDASGAARPGAEFKERLATARVVRVVERVRKDIVGTLRSTGRLLHVVPLDPCYKRDIYVPDAAGAKPGDRVIVRFGDWVNKHVSPEGEIVDVLGPGDEPSVDTVAVIRQFELRDAFPPAVVKEAASASALSDQPGPRVDLRDALVLTIDPARARDFDDALSLETAADGKRVLGVHIADVGHYVRPGSALDKEASLRGTSVYLPDHVLPMLPEQLSNGVCSLRPDEDRLAMSVFLTVSNSGSVVSRAFKRTIIRSKARLTYEEAMALIAGGRAAGRGATRDGGRALPSGGSELLHELDALARQFRSRRFAKHALNLDMPECEIVVGSDGIIKEVRAVPSDASHELVEECMIAANEAVASELARRGVRIISRLHEPPDETKIAEATAELVSMGFEPGNLNDRRTLCEFLDAMADEPLGRHVRMAVLRSLKRAVYSARGRGHFGLAKKHYAHFTSPIRRYPDLVLHRQLADLMRGREELPSLDAGDRRPPQGNAGAALDAVADRCTLTEQRAEEAERALTEIMKYRFLAKQVSTLHPETYDAVVVNLGRIGLFVELVDLRIQGLVHVSAIPGRSVRHNAARQTISAGKQTFRVGQRLAVFPTHVDFDKRRLDFGLAEPE